MFIRRQVYEEGPNEINMYMCESYFESLRGAFLERFKLSNLLDLDATAQRKLITNINRMHDASSAKTRRVISQEGASTIDSASLSPELVKRMTPDMTSDFDPNATAVKLSMFVFDKDGEQTWLRTQSHPNSVPAEHMERAMQNAHTVLSFTVQPPHTDH